MKPIFTLFLCTHKKAQIVLIQHQFYYLYLSVSLFRKASQHVLCFLSYTLLDHTASKKKQKETASTTDNESKTVLTFGLLNNTGFFFSLCRACNGDNADTDPYMSTTVAP